MRIIVPHLQRGESIAFHCPTLTRRALIIPALFCKGVSGRPIISDIRAKARRDDTRRRYLSRCCSVGLISFGRENCIRYSSMSRTLLANRFNYDPDCLAAIMNDSIFCGAANCHFPFCVSRVNNCVFYYAFLVRFTPCLMWISHAIVSHQETRGVHYFIA